jgi:hypothetical protein
MNFLSSLTVCVVVTFALAGCGAKSSAEDEVRELITSAEVAAEARDVSDVMTLIADDYADAQGFDKTQLTNFLRGYFLMHPKIELVVDIGAVEFPADGLARTRVTIAMVGTQGTASASSATGDLETVQLELQRKGDEWRVTRADRIRGGL